MLSTEAAIRLREALSFLRKWVTLYDQYGHAIPRIQVGDVIEVRLPKRYSR